MIVPHPGNASGRRIMAPIAARLTIQVPDSDRHESTSANRQLHTMSVHSRITPA